jgi:hypothetical protein
MSISRLRFFLRWRLCFSFQLRRMLFSTLFLYALGYGPEALCRFGSYGEVDAASFRSASLRAQPRAQSSETPRTFFARFVCTSSQDLPSRFFAVIDPV